MYVKEEEDTKDSCKTEYMYETFNFHFFTVSEQPGKKSYFIFSLADNDDEDEQGYRSQWTNCHSRIKRHHFWPPKAKNDDVVDDDDEGDEGKKRENAKNRVNHWRKTQSVIDAKLYRL